ncbi:MAG: Gx transporter family protein [Lachnospiraceae bacterium]|nr:Gx transporter family protein [Lachnospiraceae bacterium]
MSTKRITLDAVLTALALIIFIIELQFPEIVPIPGVKLGLANVITLIAIFKLGPVDGLIILILRIVMGSIFSGRIIAMLYSLAGGLLCFLVTVFLKKIVSKSQIWVCGVLGAIAHNLGQILVAILITQTPALLSYLPILIVSAVITGAFTGGIATVVLEQRF